MRRRGTTTLRFGDRPLRHRGFLELPPYSIVRTSFWLILDILRTAYHPSNTIHTHTNVDLLRFKRSRNPSQNVLVSQVDYSCKRRVSMSVRIRSVGGCFLIELEQCSDEPPDLDTHFLQHCSLHRRHHLIRSLLYKKKTSFL